MVDYGDAKTFTEIEAKKEALKTSDPALYAKIAEDDARVAFAYERLKDDWEMAEFFNDMAADKDKWYEKYKFDSRIQNKVYKLAGIAGEPLYLGPAGYPETQKGAIKRMLQSSNSPLLSQPVTVEMVPRDPKTLTGSSIMYSKPDDGMLKRAAASCIPDTNNVVCNMKIDAWLFFSAFPVNGGNVGQANYCAGNANLHAPTNIMRTCKAFIATGCIQWGAVGAIGMRWKAFASQDFMNAQPGALFNIQDSSTILQVTATQTAIDTPDTVAVFLFDDFSRQGFLQPPSPNSHANVLGAPSSGAPAQADKKQEKGIMTVGIMALQDPANREIEVNSAQIVVGGAPAVGKEVTLKRMRNTPEFNGLKGSIIDDLGGGRWLVKLEDEMVEEMVNKGYVKPEEKKGMKVAEEGGQLAKSDGSDSFTIAGSWDEYIPHDMEYSGGYYRFYVQLGSKGASFFVVRGKAGTKKLKYKGKTWTINGVPGTPQWYEVKLYAKDMGIIRKVTWERSEEAPESSFAAIAEGDAE